MLKPENAISRRTPLTSIVAALFVLSPCLFCFCQEGEKAAEGAVPASLENSIGMKLVPIKAGEMCGCNEAVAG